MFKARNTVVSDTSEVMNIILRHHREGHGIGIFGNQLYNHPHYVPLCMLFAWLLSISLHILDEVSWKHALRWSLCAEKECAEKEYSLEIHLYGSEEVRIEQRELLT